MNYAEIASAKIKGNHVSWANNGRVYIPRELFDKCSFADQIDFRANTPREFETICKQLAS